MFMSGLGVGVWSWVGCPCPPIHYDIVTPRHLLNKLSPIICLFFSLNPHYTDHRPPHDVDRSPWWRRTLRKDLLLVECRQLHFDTIVRDKEIDSNFHVEWERIVCSFQTTTTAEEEEGSPQVRTFPLLSAESEASAAQRDGVDSSFNQPDASSSSTPSSRRRPGVRVHILPASIADLADDEHVAGDDDEGDRTGRRSGGRGVGEGRGGMNEGSSSSSDEDAFNDAFMKSGRRRRKDPSPFAEKKVIYENEEMVTPGTKEEMKQFVDAVGGKSQVFVELAVPIVSVGLRDSESIVLRSVCSTMSS